MEPVVVLAFLAIIFFGVRSIYEHFYRLKVDVCFVKINDSNCNCYTNSARQCKNKYCPSKMMRKIISKISVAKKSIEIAMYNFTNSDLARAVIKARNRGVEIRIIVDKSTDENEDNNHSQAADLLKNGGIKIRTFGISGDAKKLMHHKFCLIDHSSPEGIVITGSLNWSYTAFKQCEDVLFVSNVPIQKEYKAAFDDIWANAVYQSSNTNTSLGTKKSPITDHINQRVMFQRHQNQNDCRA